MRIYGVTGWKDQGKTTLMERLVSAFVADGLTVSTIKHAHHAFDVDQPGRDSFRHRQAGASEVVLASRKRFALMHELRGNAEWELDALLGKLSAVDMVLVEGFKHSAHRKIELYREPGGRAPVALDVPNVRAIAGIDPGYGLTLPVFYPDDVAGIAQFILTVAEPAI